MGYIRRQKKARRAYLTRVTPRDGAQRVVDNTSSALNV